jgi:hypothetical protein
VNIYSLICKTVITTDLTPTRVDIAKSSLRPLYLRTKMEYDAHPVVCISPIAAKIPTIEYISLNMRNHNYIEFDRILS